jgi:hypothetical protein
LILLRRRCACSEAVIPRGSSDDVQQLSIHRDGCALEWELAYENGFAVDWNVADAGNFYQRSEKHAMDQLHFEKCLESENGISQALTRAATNYALSANQGNTSSQLQI